MENINPNISQLKLKKISLFAYGAGDFASNLCWTFIGTYLSVFYTDILGITPAIVSILMMIAKISDGIFDPIFGSIAERTKSRFGRFRPYIIFGSPILAIMSVLCFTKIGDGVISATFAFLSYVLCGFMYTVVNLSYGSLSTVMTSDLDDISQLNSYRMMGTNLSSVVLNAVTPPLLLFFSGSEVFNAKGYTSVAIIFSICAIPLFYFTVINCKERIQPIKSESNVSIKETINSVLKNKPLLLIFCIQLLAMTAFFGRMGILIYYIMYNLKRFDMIALFLSLPSLATVIGIYFTKNYFVKFGKKRMASIGYIGAASCLFLMFVIGRTIGYQNIYPLLVLNILYGFFCFSFPIPMAMIPDAINYAEDKFGIRSDGTSYATVSLSTKFGSAFGVSLGLMIMGVTGYVANTEQTSSSLLGIDLATNLVMGLLYILCLVPLFLYPLTESVSKNILSRLENKRQSLSVSELVQIDSEYGTSRKYSEEIPLGAVTNGDVYPLSYLKNEDPMFANGMMGAGFVMTTLNGKVYTPVEGTIISIFNSKHAIGIQTKEGIEFLIHMGIDTYELKGIPFGIEVKLGEIVKQNELIATMDLQKMKEFNKKPIVITLITSKKKNKNIILSNSNDNLNHGDVVGKLRI